MADVKKDTAATTTSTTTKRKTLDSFFKSKKPESTTKNGKKAETAEAAAEDEEDEKPGSSLAKRAKTQSTKLDDMLSGLSDDFRKEYRLELDTIDPSWLQYLLPQIKQPYFAQLKKFLKEEDQKGKTIYPQAIDVYSWSRFAPFKSIKVVILGQDPYHGPNQAHGLAFSVKPNIRIPPSLVNMYKALENDFPNKFKAPKHGFLKGWAEQGVLMLNASLTVEASKANSHANKGWEKFTDAVINSLNQNSKHLVFMLWGSYAQKKGSCVDKKKHLVLKSVHPSPLSAHRGFFDAGHFKKANEYLRDHNLKEIDWSYLPSS
ncbi:uracil DNA glycosylase [Dipsacomyces acuminosporus]|nr:uracil DNA glycosylase [Dipsacomyces acuminosporus]